MMHQTEVARQRRQQELELFRTIKQMRTTGMKVSQIARQLGLCRRRIDKWIQLDDLPQRSRMKPRSGMVFSFRAILRGGKVTTLHRWMEEARKTGIHSLVRFVRTLKQDLSAVEAAVSEPWSNGPVEGQLNRLKMLKRQMYGRAGIELLRARLLPEPAF
jgi:hypothetical protein